MTTFLVASALLLAAILVLLLLPLLRARGAAAGGTEAQLSLQVLREQLAELEREKAAGRVAAADFARERQELERRALEEGGASGSISLGGRRPWLAVTLALAVPLVAAGLYWQLGRFDALREKPAAQAGNHALNPQQIQAMAQKLAERLQQNPQDVEGWVMLARSYSVLRRFPEAAAAFGRAVSLLPGDANLLADYADTLAMAQGRRLAGEPEQLIDRALAANPNHIKALALKGSAAFERQRFQEAIGEWEKVLALVPAESSVAQGMRNSIADARTRLGAAAPQAAVPAASLQAAAPGPTISGIVSIDPAFQPEPGASLFIFARAVNGPRMPLAMQRRSADQLPLRFRLDDSMAMAPGAKLSDHRQVIVGARISRSGDALAKSGDIEGYSEPVALGSDNVRVVIAKRVP